MPGARADFTDRAGQDELLQIRNDLMTVMREIGGGDDRLFPLRYVRTPARPRSERIMPPDGAELPPVLVLPDGPGTASVLPFDPLRRIMAARGLDVLMVEHRGIGLSRLDAEGRDLPRESMTIDAVLGDLVAVLDRAEIPQAVVYGMGYGAHLAQLLAIRHPERVHSLVLDSPFEGAEDQVLAQREFRAHYLTGERERTESIARVLRRLIAEGEIDGHRAGPVLAAVHDVGGFSAVRELVDLLARGRGRLTWASVRQVLTRTWLQSTPFVQEQDLVAPIIHTELGLGSAADGGDLDPFQLTAQSARALPPFRGDPRGLWPEVSAIAAPTLILSGSEDLVTPPALARRLAEAIPRATLLTLPGVTHGILDKHPFAAIMAARWSAAGIGDQLPRQVDDLMRLPRVSLDQAVTAGLRLALAAEGHSPLGRWAAAAAARWVDAGLDPAGRRARKVKL